MSGIIKIPRTSQTMRRKGTWWWQNLDDKLVIYFSCPTCGVAGELHPDAHEVNRETGVVTPSVQCEAKKGRVKCTFHEQVTLLGIE